MAIIKLIKKILQSNISAEEFLWLENIISSGPENERLLQTAFVAVPRRIKKSTIILDKEIENQFLLAADFSPEGWTLHQFARVYIILHFNSENEKKYVSTLNTLFETAEMKELATLHSSLSLLRYPEKWLFHAKEAVRTNMGFVFDAIAFYNPYPSKHFDEAAWNQMVLKTIFNGKSIQKIHGIKERSNRELAFMISDLAHERWAAGRQISPQVWELVSPFIDNRLINDMEKLFLSENKLERYAAKLSCMHSDFEPAKDLLKKHNENFNN